MSDEESLNQQKNYIANLNFNNYFHKIVEIVPFQNVLGSLECLGMGGFFSKEIVSDLNRTGNCYQIAFYMCRDGAGLFEYVEGFFEEKDHAILHGWNYCRPTNQYFDLRNEYNGLFNCDHKIIYHQLIKLQREKMLDLFSKDKSIPIIKRPTYNKKMIT
jgi:hypothetical protein